MVANVDMDASRARSDAQPARARGSGKTAADESAVSRGPFYWLGRLAPARLTSRIILINFVGLVILVAGILYFNQSRESLIDARVESLMTQGRIMAAAVSSSATIDTGRIIIDPDKLLEQQLGEDAAVDRPAGRTVPDAMVARGERLAKALHWQFARITGLPRISTLEHKSTITFHSFRLT